MTTGYWTIGLGTTGLSMMREQISKLLLIKIYILEKQPFGVKKGAELRAMGVQHQAWDRHSYVAFYCVHMWQSSMRGWCFFCCCLFLNTIFIKFTFIVCRFLPPSSLNSELHYILVTSLDLGQPDLKPMDVGPLDLGPLGFGRLDFGPPDVGPLDLGKLELVKPDFEPELEQPDYWAWGQWTWDNQMWHL